MKARSDFQEAPDAAPQFRTPSRWVCDACEYFEQRRLTRPISAYDPNNLTFISAKRNISERPQQLGRSGSSKIPFEFGNRRRKPRCDLISQRV
jgi:hypothetical protein